MRWLASRWRSLVPKFADASVGTCALCFAVCLVVTTGRPASLYAVDPQENALIPQEKSALDPRKSANGDVVWEGYLDQKVAGWTVRVHQDLRTQKAEATKEAIRLLELQLLNIEERIPLPALEHLREVEIWFSPPYDGFRPSGEYHPNVRWLASNGRPRRLAKCIEFTNVDIFPRECVRMPMLALHELAHAYHDQILGFNHSEVIACFEQAKQAGSYASVERWFGPHRKNFVERAYAISNHKEYFAEGTEAYFGRNDFFPFTRAELQKHDPRLHELLAKLWQQD